MIESHALKNPISANPVHLPLLAAVAAWAIASAPLVAGPGWWDLKWPYRREVVAEKTLVAKLPGDDLAVVTMPTAGKVLSDGRDIRVVSISGQLMAHRVLQVGPGDVVRIAFALQGGVEDYHVYFGNEQAAQPHKELDIRRGVLLETWIHKGWNPKTLAQAQKMIQQGQTLLGRDVLGQIALGHNPFGPQSNVAQRLTGHFIATQPGQYTFATSSRNASFLLIDDKLVVDNGGAHGPQRDVSVRTTTKLAAGLHKMTMLHVSNGGNPVVMVAWKPPGAKQYSPMQPAAFARFAQAHPATMRRYGRGTGVDFIPQHRGESWFGDWYYQRYRFEAALTGRKTRVRWTWDFGDGQTSDRPVVEHVYLLPGQYTVTLTAQTPVGKLTRTNRIVVTRPWDRVTSRQLDGRRLHGRIVSGYDFAALSPGANAHAVLVLDATGQADPLLEAGKALIDRLAVPGDLLAQAASIYADRLVAAGKGTLAVEKMLAATRITNDQAVAVRLALRAGQIALDTLGDAPAAEKIYTDAIQKFATSAPAHLVRLARLGVADSYRAQRLRDRAIEAYKQIGANIPARHRSEAIYRGDLARHVEDYLNRGRFQHAHKFLSQWGRDIPADKINGYWSWMRVRLALAEKRYEDAIAETEILININIQSNYGAKLLLLARSAALRLDQKEKAAALLKRIIKDFPESPLAAEAQRLLQPPTP